MNGVKSVGTDLTEVERIAKAIDRYGERFTRRLFSDDERAYCDRKKTPAVHYAGRFAAKEAVFKILGAGFSEGLALPGGAGFRHVEVCREKSGEPRIALHGPLAERARARGIDDILISISHTRSHALAFALARGSA